MAEAAASALFTVIFQKLTDEGLKKYARSQNIHKELKDLGSKLSQIQALLNDASHKEITSESVRLWLIDLQHLAYDIDDVLDDLATEAMHREEPEATSTSMVRKLIVPTCCTNFSLTHRLSPKLDSINAQLQQLENRKSDLGLIVKHEKPKINNTSRRNETSLLEPDVVGREGEKAKLIKKLLGDDDESCKANFSIVPIVGIGGVGKTTLARLLYNDTKVKDHFELHAWVCVSDDFDILKISKTIFQAVSQGHNGFDDLDRLQVALKNELKDKRFLIVLDDVWNQNYGDWEKLVRPLHSGAPGSKIIMTTREAQLLERLGFHHLERLDKLSYKDALSLLAIHALGVENFDANSTLIPQAEGILKKCGFLPLAIKAIGSLLRARIDGEDWDDVLNSEIWDLKNSDEIVPALQLSYLYLSTDLKRLFAYCSLFPKDFLFDKEKLVLLWMAEGYLNQSTVNKSPERLGHEYFKELLSRSFFQQSPNDESLFVMHDLMNDLATFVSRDYFLRFDKQVDMANEALAKYRHMSFLREEYVGYQKFEVFKRAKCLRTLFAPLGEKEWWKTFYLSGKILVDLLPELQMLRVISLSRFEITEVPKSVGTLKHLRYLNLSRTKIKELPEEVGNLYNLETLIIFGCGKLTKLPKNFSRLKKLRHFDIRYTPCLKELPSGIGELKSLQTLTKVVIGGDSGFALIDLKGLNNLRGELCIEGLHRVQSATHAHEAILSLKGLTKLILDWVDGSQNGTLDMQVLDVLKPDSDRLKELAIVSYAGIEFSKWVGDPSFRQLVDISIRKCGNCTSLPPLGKLPLLKKLLIEGMNEVKVTGSDLTGTTDIAFRSLEILKFVDMEGWKVWSTNNEAFPCLRELHIENCRELIDVSLAALPLLGVLRLTGCANGVLRSLVRAASSITRLDICYIDGLSDDVWIGVINYLGAVEELRIASCDGIQCLWVSEGEASKILVNLKTLVVRYCDNLVSLGEKEEDDNLMSNQLSSLRSLEIWNCSSMKCCSCPNNIERLSIINCGSMTRVSFPTVGGGKKLKSLWIQECKQLVVKVNNTNMPMLEFVHIDGWENLKLITQISNSSHLTSLGLINCGSMTSLPDIQLPSLTCLRIKNCGNMTSLPDIELPSLTYLRIKNCGSMTSLPDIQLPSLTDLSIENCGSMTSLPDIQVPSLTNLSIENCGSMTSLPDIQLPSLTDLSIENCGSMTSLPDIQLPSLTQLRLINCGSMTSLPDIQLPSLTDLSIENCCSMTSLPDIQLASLTNLSIENCESLESFQLSHLPLLKFMGVIKCPRIDVSFFHRLWLPKLLELELGGLKKPISEWGTQNIPASIVKLYLEHEPHVSNFSQLTHLLPPSLTFLYIREFDNLESLSMGLQHLTSLEHLDIRKCPKMINLPETLLPSLLSLRISGCPNLKERCNGHYWPLISHIPSIDLDD